MEKRALFYFKNFFIIWYDEKYELIQFDFCYFEKKATLVHMPLKNEIDIKIIMAFMDTSNLEESIKNVLTEHIITKLEYKEFKSFCYKVDAFFNQLASYEKDKCIKFFNKHKRKCKNRIKNIFQLKIQEKNLSHKESYIVVVETNKFKTFKYRDSVVELNAANFNTNDEELNIALRNYYQSLLIRNDIDEEIFLKLMKKQLTAKELWKYLKEKKLGNNSYITY